MYLPNLQEQPQETLQTTTFLGYNHNPVIADGEFYDMMNLSGRSYPLMDQRPKRGITSLDVEGQDPVPLTGIHGRDQLVFIRGTDVYWAMQKVNGISVSADDSMMPKKIVSMGAYVCIWPDKVYFNTADLNDKGSMQRLWTMSGTNISAVMCRGDGTDYDMTDITISAVPPENPQNGQLWIDQSGENDALKQYASLSQEWVEVASTFVKLSATGIGHGLKEQDCITISGLEAVASASERIKKQIEILNGSYIVFGAGEDYIYVAGLISETQSALKDQATRFDLTVPDLDYICESNNRLWGCKYGLENGQVVNEIRATKLGDFKNWSCFMGLSTDSYTVSVGTDGPFTAAVSQRGYPVFMKENCIHRISGNAPSSFQMTTTMCRGCQEGSWRSAIVMNESIYYKSRAGVMVFDGSMPQEISTQLGGILYKDARAGAVNGKYYISMQDQNNVWQLFVYDTKTGLWYHEDHFMALGFGTVDDELYAISESDNTLVSMLGSFGAAEEALDWEAVFGLFGTDYTNQKYLSRFNLRMQLEHGSKVNLFIMYDGDGEWHDEGEIRGLSTKTFMIPVIPRRCDHLQFKLVGNGACKVYSISRILEVGGDG